MSTLDHCQTTSVHRQTTSEHRLVQDHGDRQRLSDTATRSSTARSRRLCGPSDSAVYLDHGIRPGAEIFCHAGVVQLSATLRNNFQSSEATIFTEPFQCSPKSSSHPALRAIPCSFSAQSETHSDGQSRYLAPQVSRAS